MRRFYSYAILSLLSLFSFSQINYCIPNRFSDAPYFDTSEIAVQTNILYGNAFNKFKAVAEDLKLDIYYPKQSADALSRRPLILHTHGGSFLEGDKSAVAYVCKEWARRGFVVATINYRLGWACANTVAAVLCLCNDGAGIKIALYEALQDNRAVLRFLTNHANDYGIDTDNIFLTGESAGSITALMSAYASQSEIDSFTNDTLHQALGALDSSGNSLPVGGYKLRGIINSCGAVNDTSVIGPDDMLPTISFQDQNDCLVPYKKSFVLNCTGSCYNFFPATGSYLIHQKFSSLGACSKLYEMKGSGGHCTFPVNELIKKSSCFVRGVLCNDCQSGYSTNAYDTVPCKQDIATGIPVAGVDAAGSLQVYPNPSSGENVLLTFETNSTQKIALSLVDVLGRELWHQESLFEKGRHVVTLSPDILPRGISMCSLRTEHHSASVKIVKQ